MKKSFVLLMSIMLVSLSGCDFLRALAGRPSSKDIEEKRIAIIKAEEEALQTRLDSIRIAGEKTVSDSLAAFDTLKAWGVTMKGSDKMAVSSGTELGFRYYIIVGAFGDSANARKMFNVASEKGYNPVLINSRRGMIAVGLAPTDRISSLKESYEKLRTESFCPKDAWIMVNE